MKRKVINLLFTTFTILILTFKSMGITSTSAAGGVPPDSTGDVVFGQLGDFTTAIRNKGGISADSLNDPGGVVTDRQGNVYISEEHNDRVMFYPVGSTTATRVYGQGGVFNTNISNKGGVSADSLDGPSGVDIDSQGNLYIADFQNSRVLYYPAGSTTATRVYGQGGVFNTNTSNKGGVSAESLNHPIDVALDRSDNLYVTDSYNNRVLYYPVGSTTATRVYGQGGVFDTASMNKGGISIDSLNYPVAVAVDAAGNLYVTDGHNNRVLYYAAGSTTATRVYGQGGVFDTNISNKGGVSADSLSFPFGIALDSDGALYVSESDNHRVLYFPSGSSTATYVYGQGGTFDTNVIHKGGISADSLSFPAGIHIDNSGNLYVTGYYTNRVLEHYSNVFPVVTSTDIIATYPVSGPRKFAVTFSKNVRNKGNGLDGDDAANPANYLLINKGVNDTADTTSCSGGLAADDTKMTVNSVSYDNATFTSSITLASALPVGSYKLFVCGTTSIVDLAGNPLNGGSDYTFDFVVNAVPTQTTATVLPATGFPQGLVTSLPQQPAAMAYTSTELMLEVPSINVKMPIVGVPQTDTSWDVTWLGDSAGWLDGSAFPTWAGNTVLTGHVWDSFNQPGPFADLKKLKYGDQILIHAYGQTYTYEVRESNTYWAKTAASKVFQHEDLDWVTLLTCETYDPFNGGYFFRRAVRAVLVDVK